MPAVATGGPKRKTTNVLACANDPPPSSVPADDGMRAVHHGRKSETMKHAQVRDVYRSKDSWYKWHVRGVMLEGAGQSAGQSFSWSVPSLDWDGFDWSFVPKPTEPAAAQEQGS